MLDGGSRILNVGSESWSADPVGRVTSEAQRAERAPRWPAVARRRVAVALDALGRAMVAGVRGRRRAPNRPF